MWLDAPLRCPPEGNMLPAFFYSVLLTVMLGRPELKAQCPYAGQRPLASGSSHRDLHGPRQSPQGISWQVLHEIGKRRYQYNGSPAQNLEQIQYVKFISHCAVTAPFPRQQVRHGECSIPAGVLVGAPHRKIIVA